MQRRRVAVLLAMAVAMPTAGPTAHAGGSGPFQVVVRDKGAPAPGVELILDTANVPKRLGRTGADGESGPLDFANLVKSRTEVVVEKCPDGTTRVHLVAAGGEVQRDGDCKREMAGVFIWGDAKRVVVDVGRGTVTSQAGGPGLALKVGAGALLVAGGIGLAAGGSARTTPAGSPPPIGGGSPPPSPVTPASPVTPPSPGGGTSVAGEHAVRLTTTVGSIHANATLYDRINRLALAVNGSTLTVTGPRPWVTLTGPFDAGTGNFNVAGSGTVAGLADRPITFTGNASNNRLTGMVTINELPPTPPQQVLSVDGTKN